MGNLGKLPSPMNPAAIAAPATGPASPSPQMPNMPGMPQAGAMDPLAGAPGSVDPMQLQMILQALLAGGAFNSSTMPG